MREFLTHFVSDDSGATAIEYGLIATGIAIAIIAAITAVGAALTVDFNNMATAVNP